MGKYAIVDLGSNTIRLSVYEKKAENDFHLLFSEKETAGLASYIEKGVLSPQGISRACEALENFQHLLRLFGMEEMHVFATASLRNICNTKEAVEEIQQRTGLKIDVISGEQEARLGYYGALASSHLKQGVLFDIGGGSTELVAFSHGEILSAQSLAIGSLNLFRENVSGIWPKDSEIKTITEQISKTLEQANLPEKSVKYLCGVGGTARAVLKIANVYHQLPADNRTLTRSQLTEVCLRLQQKKKKTRDLALRICPERIHTIIPGTLLIKTLCDMLCSQEIYISPYGVREGYLCRNI